MSPLFKWSVLPLSILLNVSCSEDPEKLARVEKQKAEIAELTGQIAVMEERLAQLPPDVSMELGKATEDAKKLEEELAGLETDISTLTNQKRELQAEYEAYKMKYQIK